MTTSATIINTAYKENNAVIAKPETIYRVRVRIRREERGEDEKMRR
jgi:hypothetical protein